MRVVIDTNCLLASIPPKADIIGFIKLLKMNVLIGLSVTKSYQNTLKS